ncbi:transcriptional activator DEMETER-like protein [Corchorus capsularis]|uniref:Transcriptional activator DEMETER-like protein n=1 Tax=Corchorus capsularis TaxID=210143 RepID=A0A1R3G799_COCAP|nr:transcriptional activator DEMETER-like protein [Corchorus capsularis]
MDALSDTSNAKFAHVTPDKATREERKKVTETEKIDVENRIEKGDEQANQLSTTTVDVNGLQCSKEHTQPGNESSFAATPTKENQIAENDGSTLVIFNIVHI